jgi:hypothetical protein
MKNDTQDGTKGFSPQLSGHAKADHAATSSFDAGPPKYTQPGYPSSKETAGQEEGGRKRQSTTSAVGRVTKEESSAMNDNKDENAKNPAFKVPMDLPSVKPEDYDASIDSGRGSAGQQKPRS